MREIENLSDSGLNTHVWVVSLVSGRKTTQRKLKKKKRKKETEKEFYNEHSFIVLMKTIDLRVNQVFFFFLHYRTLNFLAIVRVPIVQLTGTK